MSLDQNLFTLNITENKDDSTVLDLVDPSGVIHYHKQREPGTTYKINVYDPMSQSLLATVSAPAASSKHKTIELCNPTKVVELDYTGRISFRWNFKWEDHEFEWKREECFMLRKPDPPVLVAVTKEPAGKIKTTAVQVLDYNLNRFEIEDRKGLEIVLLTALLTFADTNEALHTPPTSPPLSQPTPNRKISDAAPAPPPKPAPRTGIDRIAEVQAMRGEINEIMIEDESSVDDYAQYCANMLQDDAMLFVTIKTTEAQFVSKVLAVVEETKRIRHKSGVDDEDLHQYVVWDAGSAAKKAPKRINLNDDRGKAKANADYSPPSNLTVHLSKIPMPELQPKAVPSVHTKKSSNEGSSFKPTTREDKEKEKLKKKGRPNSPPKVSSSTRPPQSPRVHAYQTHPQQPSPSPAQLNNPAIYTAPPPRPPQAPYTHPKPSSQEKPNLSVQMPRPQSYSPRPGQGGFAAPPGPPPGYGGNLAPPGPPPRPGSTPQPGSRPHSTMDIVSGLIDRFAPKISK